MSTTDHHDDVTATPPRRRLDRRATLGLAAAGLLGLGAAAGAVVVAQTRPSVAMAPIAPTPIHSLAADGIVTIRGRVVEIYGNKLIVADPSGRALVDTGREGDERQLVTAGQPVTVQGRFEHGFVHAAFLVGPDNKVIALGSLGGRPQGPHGPRGHHGPDDDADGPPPPAGAARPAAAPAPAPSPAAK